MVGAGEREGGTNEKWHYCYGCKGCDLLITIFKSASIEDGTINPIKGRGNMRQVLLPSLTFLFLLLHSISLLFSPLLLMAVLRLFLKVGVFGEDGLGSAAFFLLGGVLEILHVEAAGGAVEFEDEASGGEIDVQLFGCFDEGFTLVYH